MKLRMFATLALTAIISTVTVAMGASESLPTPAIQTNSASPTPQDISKPVQEAKASKADEVTIRMNAPIFSPLFAKVPLAMINDEAITIEDLKKSIGALHEGMSEGKAAPKTNFPVLLKRLVNSLLIIQEARIMELDKQEEIKSSIDDYSSKNLREMLLKEQVLNVKADAKEVEKTYQERASEWRLKSLIVDKLEDAKKVEAALKAGKKFDDLFDKSIKDGVAKEGGKSDLFLAKDVIAPPMLAVLVKMKTGEISKMTPLEKGYLFYRLEEKRLKVDETVKEQVRQELDAKARIAALETFQESLIKKYVTKKKLFDKFDFENKKVKFETFLKDKRVLAEVKGEKPITVADMAEAITQKFYHGVERAAEGKKINKEKKAILNELLGNIVFNKEAKVRKINESDEYRNKVRSYSNSLLFGSFVNKVIRSEITVSKDELKAYHKVHAAEYSGIETYKLDAIAFDSPQKAEEAIEKIRKGTEFKWYKANADNKESISKAYINMFTGDAIAKPNLPEPLQKALTGSVSGDFRAYVDGGHGYVISVVEFAPARTLTYEEVEDAIKEAVFYEKLNKGVETWGEKLKSTSDVKIYADFGQ
ncbi:MAG: hypothetical protein HGB32_06715 [Geobacteraceae bacterium]|nr:hypothetical protein [Geobacteraceae bacterium]NTW79825.1 hypothetical protein [Geobacteraceae bacterium]